MNSEARMTRSIRDRRIALGMTQAQLANAAGVSTCAISYIERGLPYNNGWPARERVAAALAKMEQQPHAD